MKHEAGMRLAGMIRKEWLQVIRDPSSIAIAFVLPLLLLLIFGYGVSLDARNVPVAVVLEEPGPQGLNFSGGFFQSPYFAPVVTPSIQEAEALLRANRVDGIIWLRANFERDYLNRGSPPMSVIVNGVDANTGRLVQNYIQAIWYGWLEQQAERAGRTLQAPVALEQRIWFNPQIRSTDFLVPGVLAVIMTLIGALLTALVMAREWERGTFESLFVTPMKILELILSKTIPYFVIAMLGMVLCLVVGRVLYDLPMRGSLVLILGESMLYLVVALGIGLVISGLTKNQFLACHVSLMISFLPSVVLTGFLFDLHAEPMAIRVVSSLIPTTYYLELMKSLFLSGNYWPLIVRDTAVLLAFALFFLGWAFRITRKKVEP